jgi:uracil-DNA glycosylase
MAQKRLDAFFKATKPSVRAAAASTGDFSDAPARTTPQTYAKRRKLASDLRASANRNLALARQAVIACEKQGTAPALADLLVDSSWQDALRGEFSKPYFLDLQRFVESAWSSSMVFPPKACVFRAFNAVPLDQVRVVILGQDPYHGLSQAQGLSFSVPTGMKLPSSLRNIYKEISEDVGCSMPKENGCLEPWAHQGVLMLNSVLTVEAHKAASHSKKGWEEFTTHAVRVINKERSGVVFMLWGKYAQEKGSLIDAKRHHVLKAPHPSGLSAHRGFFGCKHFSRANALLKAQGDAPIDWKLD